MLKRALFLVLFLAPLICSGKIVPRRDPLDGALNATHIVIVKELSPGRLEVQESFLGDAKPGQILEVPGFKLVVEDRSTPFCCRDRVEPIRPEMRILVFLMHAPPDPPHTRMQRYGEWAIAGFGNCYFWSDDPEKLDPLRKMAADALQFRGTWQKARDTPDILQRIQLLWPFLWARNYVTYELTLAELQKIGPPAGDIIADQLPAMTRNQKDVFMNSFAEFHSERLHQALIRELSQQKALWEETLAREGRTARESDDYGILFQGLVGLDGFENRADLPFIRELAAWAIKYRFKQVDDAALRAFEKMPDRANVPLIAAIWKEFSERPWAGNELHSFEVIRVLSTHHYPEAVPLMAQFVNVGFMQETARQFLVAVTGIDYGGDTAQWLAWYESYRRTHR